MKLGNRIVYMDHNATTPLHPEVKKKMAEAMEFYGNPSSLHSFVVGPDIILRSPEKQLPNLLVLIQMRFFLLVVVLKPIIPSYLP